MRHSVKCVRCGAQNELNRLFCSRCGTRLDMRNVRSEGSRSGGIGRFIANLFRAAVYLAVFGVMGLMLWPVQPVGALGQAEDEQSIMLKRDAVLDALDRHVSVTEMLSEKEVNAYLAAVLARSSGATTSKGLQLGIREINLTFTPTCFVVFIDAGWGPVRLTYEVTGTPVVGEGSFGVKVSAARWGHLPLPGRAAAWMSGRMSGVFSNLEEERRLLDGLSAFELGEGSVRLVTRSGGT